MDLQPPDHHQLLVFWVALLVLLAVARLLGLLCQRLGQPSVVGELGAGIVLGPTVLGRLAPDVTAWLFPDDDAQTAMLFAVAWLGVAFLLLVTGFETDLKLIRSLGRALSTVATGSLLVPAAIGFAMALAMPAVLRGDVELSVFALFMAAAMSISALPVIAKVLSELGVLRRNVGQLILAAGMVNDIVGWAALGVIAGLAQAGVIDAGAVALLILGIGVFFAGAFTVGQRALDAALRWARARSVEPLPGFTVVVIFAFAAASLAQWLGVEAVLGTFVVGMLLARSRYADHTVLHPIELVTNAVLAPIFFATAGLRVDLGLLVDPVVAIWAAVVFLSASAGKFLGAGLGAVAARLPRREALALGAGLNARGALEIVIAAIGLSLGVLNDASYTVVVVTALLTSMLAPPLLRTILGDWAGTEVEQERLRREETLRTNILVGSGRILLPAPEGSGAVLAAQVLSLAWPPEADATVMAIDQTLDQPDVVALVSVLADRDVDVRQVGGGASGDAAAERILAEARLGYSVIGLGADDLADDPTPSPLVEAILQGSDVPVVLVRRPRGLDRRLPWAFARALVGVTGTRTSKAAQEIAAHLSAHLGTEMVLAHVQLAGVAPGQPPPAHTPDAITSVGLADRLVEEAAQRAEAVGARVRTMTRHATTGADGLVALIEEEDCDLVVLGASRRDLADRAFLGHTAERILSASPVTVVIVVLPERSGGR